MYNHIRQKSKSPVPINIQISNSCDFSLAETSSLIHHPDPQAAGAISKDCSSSQQNPSWINLRSLKDMIRKSSSSARDFRSQGDREVKQMRDSFSKNKQNATSNINKGDKIGKRAPLASHKSCYNSNFNAPKAHQTASTQRESGFGQKRSAQYNSCNSLNKLRYTSTSSGAVDTSNHQTSRTIQNPRDLMLLPVVDSSPEGELSKSTINQNLEKDDFPNDDENDYLRIEIQKEQQQQQRFSQFTNPLDAKYNSGINYLSRNNTSEEQQMNNQNFQSVPFSNITHSVNHIDTPQSVFLLEDMRESYLQGHEIESLLKSQINFNPNRKTEDGRARDENIKERNNSDQMLTSSPYGNTQELDLQNLNENEEFSMNEVQAAIQHQDDDKTDDGRRVSHRLEQQKNDDFPQHLLQASEVSSQNSQQDRESSRNRSVSGGNLFKRQKNHQPSQSRDSLSSTRQTMNVGASNNQVEIRSINLNIEKVNKAASNTRKSVNGNQVEKAGGTNSLSISKVMGQKKLIDLTKRSFDQFQPQKAHIGYLQETITDSDKENQNPYQNRVSNLLINKISTENDQQDALRLKMIDKDFDQFCEQIDIMITHPEAVNDQSFKRKQAVKSTERQADQNQYIYTNNQDQTTPLKQFKSHQSLDLSVSQSKSIGYSTISQDPFSNLQQPDQIQLPPKTLVDETISEIKDQLQQSPGPQLEQTMQQSFKRSRPCRSNNLRKSTNINSNNNKYHVQQKSINLTQCQNSISNNKLFKEQIDVSQIEQQSSLDMSLQSNPIQEEMNEIQQQQRLELLQIKRENVKLQRQLDSQEKLHQEQIKEYRKQQKGEFSQQLKEAEEENQIIIESLKQESYDKISELKSQYQAKIEALELEHKQELADKDQKIERKREKIYILRDQFDQKRKEYNQLVLELEAYKSKIEEMTQYQLQNNVNTLNRDSVGNVFQTTHQSVDQFQTTKNHLSYFTSRDHHNVDDLFDQNLFESSEVKQQPTPYQSFDNFLDLKKNQLDLNNSQQDPRNSLTYQSISSSNYASDSRGPALNAFNNLSSDAMLNYYFSLSQQQQQQQPSMIQQNSANKNQIAQNLKLNPMIYQEQDSAMNFSFSEVKTSLDVKSSFFEKHNNFGSLSSVGVANGGVENQLRETNKNSILDIISQGNESEDDESQTDLNQNRLCMIKRKPKSQVTSIQFQDDSGFINIHAEGNINLLSNNADSYDKQETVRNNIQSQSQLQQSLYDSAIMQIETQKSLSVQHSQIYQQEEELEPTSENYIDDEEDQSIDQDQDEESKSNLSHKIEDMNASMSMGVYGVGSQKLNQNIIYQIDHELDEDDEEETKQNISHKYEGSENAPEDSGFVTDDGEGNERIVNESSLYNDEEEQDACSQAVVDYYNQGFSLSQNNGFTTTDPYLLQSYAQDQTDNFNNQSSISDQQQMILTGRSESAMDDQDDEIEGISQCKAINSSYINLKRNNLLISFGPK